MKTSKELILNGTDNNRYRHRYSFEKNEQFKTGFIKFMKDLEFNEKELKKIKEKFIIQSFKENEKGGEDIVINLKIIDIVDVCWYFQNKKYEVDVFFGEKKIIILIKVKSKQYREDVLDNLEEKSGWISEEEKEKRLNKNKLKERIIAK